MQDKKLHRKIKKTTSRLSFKTMTAVEHTALRSAAWLTTPIRLREGTLTEKQTASLFDTGTFFVRR